MSMAVDGGMVIGWLRSEGILDLTDGFSASDDLFLAGLDSMAVMQLVVAAEDRFGVVLQAADLSKENLGSADALAVLINRRCV